MKTKMPFVRTWEKWQQITNVKEEDKKRKDQEKQSRKQQRVLNKQEKDRHLKSKQKNK